MDEDEAANGAECCWSCLLFGVDLQEEHQTWFFALSWMLEEQENAALELDLELEREFERELEVEVEQAEEKEKDADEEWHLWKLKQLVQT